MGCRGVPLTGQPFHLQAASPTVPPLLCYCPQRKLSLGAVAFCPGLEALRAPCPGSHQSFRKTRQGPFLTPRALWHQQSRDGGAGFTSPGNNVLFRLEPKIIIIKIKAQRGWQRADILPCGDLMMPAQRGNLLSSPVTYSSLHKAPSSPVTGKRQLRLLVCHQRPQGHRR